MVSGKALASSLKNGQHLKTVEGKSLDVHLFDNKVFINDAEVVIPNVNASNGVVHVINKVLNPHFHV